MAHLWISERSANWAVMPLEDTSVNLTHAPPRAVYTGAEEIIRAGEVVMLFSGGNAGVWALIAGQGANVRVNGSPLAAGIRILADRDEIIVGNAPPVYFSTERLAAIENFAGTGTTAFCPRCKQAIGLGTPSVKCPGCAVFYHQSDELPCWTYSEVCALCPHSTEMGIGYQWSPEVL